MKGFPTFLFTIVILVFSCGAVIGQDNPLIVQVRDPDNLAVVGARVSLSTPQGTPISSGTTGADGKAVFSGVRSGGYRLEVVAPGFAPYSKTGIAVSNQVRTITVELQLATVATSIEVSAPAIPMPTAERQSGDTLAEAATPSAGLVDTLNSVPGVDIQRRGGTNLLPIVRGLRETQIAMVVDDTRTFAAGPGGMDSDLSHVDPNYVGEMQVVKGPYALTEASGAFSAVLVKTPEIPRYPDWTLRAKTRAGYSTNGAGRFGQIQLLGGVRRFGFDLHVSGRRGNDYGVGHSPLSIPGDYSQHQFGGKFRFNPIENQELTFTTAYDEENGLDFPGRLLNADYFITRSWNGTYQISRSAPWLYAVTAKLYLNKKSHRMSNREKPTAMDMPGRTPPFALDVSLPTESDTWGGALGFDMHPRPVLHIHAGMDFYNLHQNADRFISRKSNGLLLFSDRIWPDAEIRNQGIYLLVGQGFERGDFSAATRLDFVQASAGTPSKFFLANTLGDLNQNEVNPNFSATGHYQLFEGISIGGGFGRVVRTATALERYSDRFPSTKFQISAEFLGDPSIQPEVSYQWDLGLSFQAPQFLVQFSGFYQRIEDFITVAAAPGVPKRLPLSPPTVFRYLNGDHANFRGADFLVEYHPVSELEWKLQGAYTLADDIEMNNPAIGQNEPALGIPPFELQPSLRYTDPRGRFWGQVSSRVVWDQTRVATLRFEHPSPGFTTYALRLGARMGEKTTLQFGIENLGDKGYFEHVNSPNPFTGERIPEPGRSFSFTLDRTW